MVPPSITCSLPVIYDARSETRKATSSATSSGRQGRPSGIPPRESINVWRALLRLNPMTPFVVAYQDVIFFGHVPGAADTFLIVAYSLVALGAGIGVFGRLRDTLAEAI